MFNINITWLLLRGWPTTTIASENHFHQIEFTWWRRQILCVTGPSSGESSDHGWIPLINASGMEFWCFLWSAHEQTVKQTIETLLFRDIALIMAWLWCKWKFFFGTCHNDCAMCGICHVQMVNWKDQRSLRDGGTLYSQDDTRMLQVDYTSQHCVWI